MSFKTKITDESGDKKYFTIIPNYILNHSTLWDREVYIQMKRITGEDGTCWTSQKNLANQCGISVNRLKKSIQYLIENQWIEFVGTKPTESSGGTQETKEYKVIDLWEKNIQFYKDKGVSSNDTPITKGVSRDAQRGITSEAKGVSPSDDKEEPILKKNPINKNTEIYTLYKEKINSNAKCLEKANTKIRVRLKNFSYEELKKAINNFSKNKWQMEHNAGRGMVWFFHSDERIENYLNMKSGIIPKSTKYANLSNKLK